MNALIEIIQLASGTARALPFSRFMELALYHVKHGYYERAPQVVGKRGDFYTSVSVGSLFGELLAADFAEKIAQSSKFKAQSTRGEIVVNAGAPWQIVEAGAHDGALARDILTFLREYRPETFANVEYWIIEPSPRRQEWQRTVLAEFDGKVRWFDSLNLLSAGSVNGVLFANELLDAFPVRRIGWDATAWRWFEWGVHRAGEGLVWTRMWDGESQPIPLPMELPDDLLAVLPDGFTTEICPAAEAWWKQAAEKLGAGHLVTFDYGLLAEDFFRPERANGTLRAYREHRVSDDVLANPGEQDLTAHVNFTVLQRAGEMAGLRTEGLVTQGKYLTAIAEESWKGRMKFPVWTAPRVRQFQTLTHPEHLGRAFRVLVQGRG